MARDYRAEYAARIARGKARGLSVAQATGKAARAGAPSVSSLRASGALKAPSITSNRAPKIVNLPQLSTRIVTSRDRRTLTNELRQAYAAGATVAVRATFANTAGRPTTVDIGGGSGTRRQGGGGAPEERSPLFGKVKLTITTNPAVIGGGSGIDLAKWMDDLDDGEDVLDLIYEAWADGMDEDGS